MYTPYLIVGYVVTFCLALIGFRVIRRTLPGLRGQRRLYQFLLCAIFGLLLFGMRPWAPSFLTIVLPNFLIFGGALLLYLAATEILEVQPQFITWEVNICLAALAPFLWFTYVQPSMLARLLIHAAVVSFVATLTSLLLFRHDAGPLRSSLRAAGWLFATLATLQVVWCAAAILNPPTGSFMHLDLMETAFSYLSLLLALANVGALVWLSLCVHRSDLHRMAQTDSLTGLLNRRAFEDIVHRELPRAGRAGHSIGALLIDIDHFKRINDSLGHHAGDEALRRIADALRESTRISDVLARYGGEEFVILLRDAGLEESAAIAERVRVQIAALTGLPGGTSLTASIGVAIGHAHETVDDFLLRSDEALYRAKRGGRNLVSICRGARHEPVHVL